MFQRILCSPMVSIPVRCFSSTSSRNGLNMASLLQRSIKSVDAKEKAMRVKHQKRAEAKEARKKEQQQNQKEALSAELMNDTYRSEFRSAPTAAESQTINNFFFNSHVQLDWMTMNFLEMPGEKARVEAEQKKIVELEEQERSLGDIVEFEDDEVTFEEDQKVPKKKKEEVSTGFVKPGITIGLPEVVFLGKCNVGKSTLLNALVTPSSNKDLTEFAYASKVAGYTKSLNAFNLGDRLRIIDTPGYGVKGRPAQGKQVLEYLQNRKELRKVYLLIGSVDGFNNHDDGILDFLFTNGIPFEIVFTKVDKVLQKRQLTANITKSGILEEAQAPELLFTASGTNKKFDKRQGFTELRKSILSACGLPYDIRPLKKRQ
ncbi:unnamed protein product [Wickerhamomyces anomalus]